MGGEPGEPDFVVIHKIQLPPSQRKTKRKHGEEHNTCMAAAVGTKSKAADVSHSTPVKGQGLIALLACHTHAYTSSEDVYPPFFICLHQP
jgi:hypothetical protein